MKTNAFFKVTVFILFLFLLNPALFARTVSCKVLDDGGKTVGYYSHSSDFDPVCDCKNLEIPESLMSVCVESVKEIY